MFAIMWKYLRVRSHWEYCQLDMETYCRNYRYTWMPRLLKEPKPSWEDLMPSGPRRGPGLCNFDQPFFPLNTKIRSSLACSRNPPPHESSLLLTLIIVLSSGFPVVLYICLMEHIRYLILLRIKALIFLVWKLLGSYYMTVKNFYCIFSRTL